MPPTKTSPNFLTAIEELEQAKSILRRQTSAANQEKIQAAIRPRPLPPRTSRFEPAEASPQAPGPAVSNRKDPVFDDTRNLAPSGTPLQFASPLHLLRAIAPDMVPHKWQAEELLRLGGFLDPYSKEKATPDEENRFLYGLAAANGSGKDQFIISAFAVWFALHGIKNRCIITSSSRDQVKFQTEPGIKYIIERFNQTFGSKWFRSVEFHHVCLETGSEIKLFSTDEPGRAEGYHPWPGGKMALIMNEAKSIPEDIYDALRRCTGYSYWLGVSSPGGKSGTFYNNSLRGVRFPAACKLNQFFYRHVSAYECPNISRADIADKIRDMPDWWVDSSINAEFSSAADSVVIPDHYLLALAQNLPPAKGDHIGIGLDTAGGVDENSCYVRRGNQLIAEYHFRQRDTTETANSIDSFLAPWRNLPYAFNADDGGISQAITDTLVKLGWKVHRRRNQSPAGDKRRFLNLGAETWWKVRQLVIRREVRFDFYDQTGVLRHNYAKLVSQLTSRRLDGEESAQGKLKLEPKPIHKQRMRESPDRADALVLCFYSFKSAFFQKPEPTLKRPLITSMQDFASKYGWEDIPGLTSRPPNPYANDRFTFQTHRI